MRIRCLYKNIARKLTTLLIVCSVSVVTGLIGNDPATRLHGQTSYPMIMSISPVAAQTGAATEHVVAARYSMYGAGKILVSGDGVTGTVVTEMPEVKPGEKPPGLTKLKIRFDVTDDAQPGVRDFRIATHQGVSTLGQVVIVRDPVVSEEKNNDTPENAQEVTLPATLCGVIEKAEDVDYFRFKVNAGDAHSFHVRSMRLQNKIHDLQQHSDPLLTLRTAAGNTVATSDNYFFGDPYLAHTFAEEGEYLLEIRDVRYQGNQYWNYSIEIHPRPSVLNAFPLGVTAGKETSLKLIGHHLTDQTQTSVNVDAKHPQGQQWVSVNVGRDLSPDPVPLVITDLPCVNETDQPNNTAETAQSVTVPGGLNGTIESASDIDCFSFEAKKGEKYTFEVIARRHQSALDSNLRILNAEGRRLSENDDMRVDRRGFADSLIENWTVPADGTYVVEIRDLHLRGGENFVYFIEVTKAQPHFELYLDTDKTQLTPGTHGVLFANVVRKNGFTGEVQLHAENIPEGITAHTGRVLASGKDGSIVLETTGETPPAIQNIRVWGTALLKGPEGEEETLTVEAMPYQEIYQPGGGRGHWPVSVHTVSVAKPADLLSLELDQYDLTLKPGESKQVKVTITRADGFDKNVTLDLLYRHLNRTYANPLPAGITIDTKNSKTLLTGKTLEGHITLKANAKAEPVEKQQVAVMANVSLNFVMKATYSSRPLTITIAAPE